MSSVTVTTEAFTSRSRVRGGEPSGKAATREVVKVRTPAAGSWVVSTFRRRMTEVGNGSLARMVKTVGETECPWATPVRVMVSACSTSKSSRS